MKLDSTIRYQLERLEDIGRWPRIAELLGIGCLGFFLVVLPEGILLDSNKLLALGVLSLGAGVYLMFSPYLYLHLGSLPVAWEVGYLGAGPQGWKRFGKWESQQELDHRVNEVYRILFETLEERYHWQKYQSEVIPLFSQTETRPRGIYESEVITLYSQLGIPPLYYCQQGDLEFGITTSRPFAWWVGRSPRSRDIRALPAFIVFCRCDSPSEDLRLAFSKLEGAIKEQVGKDDQGTRPPAD